MERPAPGGEMSAGEMSYSFFAQRQDISPADISPPGAGRSLTSAVASGRKIRRHSLVGFIMWGSGFVLAFLCYIYVRSLCVGIHKAAQI